MDFYNFFTDIIKSYVRFYIFNTQNKLKMS